MSDPDPVETQYQFQHHWLMEVFQDRKPRDEAASTGQFLKTEYVYLSNGRIDYVLRPNGSRTDYDLDGFGTLYRSVTQDPAAAQTVSSRKSFINPFLEQTGSYEYTGTDHLWTTITRNGAGAITQIEEPSATAPSGYGGATGGAIHQFAIDELGRVVEARAYTGTPSSTTLAKQREIHYDQLDRQIWQHDVALGFGSSGDHYVAWQYASAKASQLNTVKRTGMADQTYSYNNATSPVTGFLTTINDGFSGGGNTVTYAYHAHTIFLSGITRVDLDPASSTPRTTATTYDVDPFGHVITVTEGSGTTLDSAYAYDSLGRVDQYTDPMGRVQKFLADGMGRIVEHARVGSGSAIINSVVFDDAAAPTSDGHTTVSRYDGLGNETISHTDFAGRPFIVQNPGGNIVPTSSAKNKSMCLYAEYDSASRIKAIYDGDGGKIDIWRDGPGRMIQRQLTVAGSNHARFNSKDVLLRDAIGRLYETNIVGSTDTDSSPNHALSIVDEEFDVDSFGRIHEERYEFPYFAPVNELKVSSTFASGAPYRSDLDYADGLTGSNAALSAPINLDFDHDSIGRLTSIEWNVSGGSGQQPLAGYTWVGVLRRNRTVHYGSSQYPQGVTAYDYDTYNRLLQIQDEVWTSSSAHATKSQFDYEYDAASNLLKETYTKVDTSVGDRFAYDAYHRLTSAAMGVNSMSGSMPTAWSSGAMHQFLTYALDEANNRTSTGSWVSSTAQPTDYTLQDSGHAQGQSNRYDVVTLPGASPVTYEYDDRGNLRYDGRFLFQYDFLNRLQEVWKVTLVEGETGDAEKFAVIEQTALRDSKQEVKDSIPDLMSRLPREHKDPVFRSRLKARLHGGVIRLHPPQQGGGSMLLNPQWLIAEADLELAAVYGYDAYNRRIMSIVVDSDWSDTAFHTYDRWHQVVQYTLDDSNTSYKAAPTKEFVWGSRLDELISYRRRVGGAGSYSWENYFILHGGQDTAVKLVNSSGAVVEQYEYDPYGRVSFYNGSAYGLPFLWKGIRRDNETGLLYMRNRYYSVEIGRFLTSDPLGTWGDAMNGGNGIAYVGNMPLSHGDPLGLQGDDNHEIPILGLVGIGPQSVGSRPGLRSAVARRLLGRTMGMALMPLMLMDDLLVECGRDAEDPPPKAPDPAPPEPAQPAEPETASPWGEGVSRAEAELMVAERKNYHKTCDEPAPKGLGVCALLRWKLDKAKRCRNERQAYIDKWKGKDDYPGHPDAVAQKDKEIKELTKEYVRKCGPEPVPPPTCK